MNSRQGAIEVKKVAEVKEEPYLLPSVFEWFDVNLRNSHEME